MRLGTAGMKSAGRPRIQTPQAGQVVLSLAGRDAGRLMVVLERSVEEGFVLTADGRRRKLANPKRKRARHLRTVGAALKPEQYAGCANPFPACINRNNTAGNRQRIRNCSKMIFKIIFEKPQYFPIRNKSIKFLSNF